MQFPKAQNGQSSWAEFRSVASSASPPAVDSTVSPAAIKASSKARSLMTARLPAKRGSYWDFLCALWAAYFLAVHSIGRYPEWTSRVTWGGALIVGVLTAFGFRAGLQRLPREAWILWAFAAWCLTGVAFIVDLPAFMRGLQMALELAMTATLLGIIIRNASSVNWFYVAFIGAAFFNVLVGLDTLSLDNVAPDSLEAKQRNPGLTGNANSLGFYCFLGLLSVMGLLGEVRSVLGRVALLGLTLPALYGLVVSASRGAFIIFMIVLLLWPILCLRHLFRNRLLVFLVAAMAIALAVGFERWVVDSTRLGERLAAGFRMEDHSSVTRVGLFYEALEVAANNPITGIGVGQFQFVNGFDLVSHDEWGDLLSATGLVGFALFMSVYASLWLRLSRARRRAQDSRLRYRLNFARLTLLGLVIAGLLFRTNFMAVDSIFLIALVIGVAEWADQQFKGCGPSAVPPQSGLCGRSARTLGSGRDAGLPRG
jgi:O-antigen ligase